MNRDHPEVHAERVRREALLERLREHTSPQATAPMLIRQLGIHPGQQGIFRDLSKTQHLAASGVALAIRHTGTSYADDLSDEAVIYHYPTTTRPGRDAPEIESLKTAERLALPLFVIVTPEDESVRDVRTGWVVKHSDELGWALITFEAPAPLAGESTTDPSFSLVEARAIRRQLRKSRPGQTKFKFGVFARYGATCAACGLTELQLLEAAHLCPVSASGTNNPLNGLVLCLNHHKALDSGLLRINPASGEFVGSEGHAAQLERLGVKATSLSRLRARPHELALQWRWEHSAKAS